MQHSTPPRPAPLPDYIVRPLKKKLPKSIWTIVYVDSDLPEHDTDLPVGVKRFYLRVDRRGRTDTFLIFSKEGAAPQVGGLLERMELPGGGIAVIWSDKDARGESVGGGYSKGAMPREWGVQS